MKITAMLQIFNEMKFNNLKRYMHSISKYCDALVVYDDASIDGSVEYLEKWNIAHCSSDIRLSEIHIIRGQENNYAAEVDHKAQLVKRAIEIDSNWIFRIDADEVIEKKGEEGCIRELCAEGDRSDIDSWAFRNANFWRSPAFCRIDNLFDKFISCRLWKNNGSLAYSNVKHGLHQRAVPDGLKNEATADIITLHYGFASDESILHKYHMYYEHGQRGWELDRLIDERTLRVAPSNPCWFNNPPKEINAFEFFQNRPLLRMLIAKND